LFSDALLLFFPRFNFRCARIPSSNAAFFYQRVITNQEPSIDAIFSENSRFEFERVILQESALAYRSHLPCIEGMNYPTDHVRRPELIKCQPCVFTGDTIGVNPRTIRGQHHANLRN